MKTIVETGSSPVKLADLLSGPAIAELENQLRRPLKPKPRTGIPTTYAGVKFRSMHEATWARFLHSIGLGWEYEPAELRFYIPDFVINFTRRPLLVEIKPLDEDIELVKSKLECSGWPLDAAILISAESKVLGAIYEPDYGWDRAVLAACMACHKPTIVAESGRWACRSCGADRRSLWFAYDERQMWHDVKNKTQWRAAK